MELKAALNGHAVRNSVRRTMWINIDNKARNSLDFELIFEAEAGAVEDFDYPYYDGERAYWIQ